MQIRIKMLVEAASFIESLNIQERKKITYILAQVLKGVKDPELFKKLDSDIWELRASVGGNALRLFAFWDKHSRALIVATHGIYKKQRKTPRQEIDRARNIMQEYYKTNYDGK